MQVHAVCSDSSVNPMALHLIQCAAQARLAAQVQQLQRVLMNLENQYDVVRPRHGWPTLRSLRWSILTLAEQFKTGSLRQGALRDNQGELESWIASHQDRLREAKVRQAGCKCMCKDTCATCQQALASLYSDVCTC